MMDPEIVTSYDALPYESHPYAHTHPDQLAAKAMLFGMTTPDVDGCRVLELGCAGGGNIIPMAVSLPGASFVGIDLSQRQLKDGWGQIERLGLKNVELQHRSILDVSADDGAFDYIVCHGVFSWVDREVQEAILRICHENLAPNGVAYISYNTNPGWFLRGMVRQMMCYHAAQFDDPETKVRQARALLDFLINAGPAGDATYHGLLTRELEIIRNRQDSYLYHEHLEDVNEPLFFHEFVERAEAHNLRYLCESQFSEMVAANYGEHVDRTLRELNAGLIHTEQYLDFLCNRTFRRTLLCHKEVELNRQLGHEQLKGLRAACHLKPDSAPQSLAAPGDLSFHGPSGSGPTVTVSRPLLKGALVALGKVWPEAAEFEDLPALAHREMGQVLVRTAADFEQDLQDLSSLVLELYAKDLLELRSTKMRFASTVPEIPVVSPIARLQAEDGPYVTTLGHSLYQLSDLSRHLVKRLDGTVTRADLKTGLRELVDKGELVIERPAEDGNGEVTDELLDRLLHGELETLAENALFLPEST